MINRHATKQNSYKCFTVENCIINKDNKIICNNCNTEIGTRQNITYLKDEDEDEDEDDDLNINEVQSCVRKEKDESEIWTLISSDFSTLRAPTLNIADEEEDELFVSDQQQMDSNNQDNDKNKNSYMYHLTNVLPGLV